MKVLYVRVKTSQIKTGAKYNLRLSFLLFYLKLNKRSLFSLFAICSHNPFLIVNSFLDCSVVPPRNDGCC